MASTCPKCGSGLLRISRIKLEEKSLGHVLKHPVRCRECKHRFWQWNQAALLGSAVFGAFVLFSIGAIVFLVWSSGHDTPLEASLAPSSLPVSISAAVPEPQPQDTSHANQLTVEVLRAEAQQGSADAQFQLGMVYLYGRGALQDYTEAVKWIQSAANLGQGDAQYRLGLLYRTGLGVPADQRKAYIWLNLAAAGGVNEAATARDDVARNLNAQQLTEAQKESRAWRPLKQHEKHIAESNAEPSAPAQPAASAPPSAPNEPASATSEGPAAAPGTQSKP